MFTLNTFQQQPLFNENLFFATLANKLPRRDFLYAPP